MTATADEAAQFVRSNHHAVLVTRRRDGRVQTSPVVAGVLPDGTIAVSLTEDRAKTKNLRHDPRITLCVLPEGYFGRWIQVDGTAELVEASTPDGMTGLEAVYRDVSGEHPDWDDFRSAMLRERRVLCRVAVDPQP